MKTQLFITSFLIDTLCPNPKKSVSDFLSYSHSYLNKASICSLDTQELSKGNFSPREKLSDSSVGFSFQSFAACKKASLRLVADSPFYVFSLCFLDEFCRADHMSISSTSLSF